MHLLVATLLVLGSAQARPLAPAVEGPPSIERPPSVERRPSVERSRDLLTASSVLHAWDERREAAWAASDAVALRSLYVRGSSASRSDVRLLRQYAGRGLVVRSIVTQVFALQVLRHDSTSIRLRIVDRVAGGVVETGMPTIKDAAGSRRPLGTTRPAVRVVLLRRVGGEWKIAEVSARD